MPSDSDSTIIAPPAEVKTKPRRGLRPREQAFITAYTSSGSTFGNATRSYLHVNPGVTIKSAQGQGSVYLSRPIISEPIADILNKAQLGLPSDPTSVALVKPRVKRPTNPKDQAFITAYANPSSSTFGNATQSYLTINPHVTYKSARVQGSTMLTYPRISEPITEIINRANMGVEVRIESLSHIIAHKDIGKTTSRVRHTEDETITTTESGPAHRDILKSIDLLNKIDGTYDRNRAAADIATTEYRSLVKRFFSLSDKGPRGTRGEGGQTAPQVLDVSHLPQADKISTGEGLENPGEIS